MCRLGLTGTEPRLRKQAMPGWLLWSPSWLSRLQVALQGANPRISVLIQRFLCNADSVRFSNRLTLFMKPQPHTNNLNTSKYVEVSVKKEKKYHSRLSRLCQQLQSLTRGQFKYHITIRNSKNCDPLKHLLERSYLLERKKIVIGHVTTLLWS